MAHSTCSKCGVKPRYQTYSVCLDCLVEKRRERYNSDPEHAARARAYQREYRKTDAFKKQDAARKKRRAADPDWKPRIRASGRKSRIKLRDDVFAGMAGNANAAARITQDS